MCELRIVENDQRPAQELAPLEFDFSMVKENACFGRNIAPRGDQHGGCVWLS
jgi:hypothetical protein